MSVRWISFRAVTCVLLFGALAQPTLADERGDRVNQLFSAWDNSQTPGAVVAVATDDEVLHVAAFGMLEANGQEPITRETRFYLASGAKQFTAACIADLARRRLISLDDDIRKHLPEIPDYGSQVTVAHLIHHRSGLRDFFELMTLAKRDLDAAVTPQEVLDLVCRQRKLQFQPGEDFLYSNTNYFLLALIVERVSGQSIRDYAGERIFTPLGMAKTEFRAAAGHAILDVASGHTVVGGDFVPRHSQFTLPGSGGVYSTVDDLLLWQRNMSSGDNWGGADLVTQLQTPPALKNTQRQSPQIGPYAFGLIAREYKGLPVIAGLGGSFGYEVMMLRFPSKGLSIIVLANSGGADASRLAFAAADIYLEDDLIQPEEPARNEETKPGFSVYQSVDDGGLLVLSTRPTGETHITTLSYKVAMRSTASGFVSTDAAIGVVAEKEDVDDHHTLSVQVGDELPIQYRPISLAPVDSTIIEAIAGEYASEEIGAEIRFVMENGRLCLDDDGMGKSVAPFMPISKDLLLSDTGVRLDVKRGADGQVRTLVISTPRARGVVLMRK